MTDSIFKTTKTCQDAFARCVSNPALAELLEWLENRQGDLNLWASELGATKEGKASLDYRVKDRPDVSEAICELLDSIHESLEQMITPKPEDVPDKQSIAETHATTPAHWYSDIFPKTTGTTVQFSYETDPDPTISNSEDEEPYSEQMDNIQTILHELSRISIAIRKSGSKYRFQKADSSLQEGDYDELKNHLTLMILLSSYDTQSREQLNSETALSPGRLTSSQVRLIHANIVRRNRIRYATRNMPSAHTHKSAVTTTLVHVPATVVKQEPSEATIVTSHKPSSSKVVSVVAAQSSLLAPSATEIGSQFDLKEAAAKETPSVKTKITRTGASQDYPRCPEPRHGNMIQCPYYGDVLPLSYLANESRWRGHVAQDLLPYTCFLDNCSTPDEMYPTTDELTNHMLKEHSVPYWMCDFCATGSKSNQELFLTEGDWEAHMRNVHTGAIPVNQLPILSTVSHTMMLEPMTCPLCAFSAKEVSMTINEHITHHLHEFALKALPWTSLTNDESSFHNSDTQPNTDLTIEREISSDEDDEQPQQADATAELLRAIATLDSMTRTQQVREILTICENIYGLRLARSSTHYTPIFEERWSNSVRKISFMVDRFKEMTSWGGMSKKEYTHFYVTLSAEEESLHKHFQRNPISHQKGDSSESDGSLTKMQGPEEENSATRHDVHSGLPIADSMLSRPRLAEPERPDTNISAAALFGLEEVAQTAELAQNIYRVWCENWLLAGPEYKLFSENFKQLAENLSLLVQFDPLILHLLQKHGARPAAKPLWDVDSLLDIVGDFNTTLKECHDLLKKIRHPLGKNLMSPALGRRRSTQLTSFVRSLNDRISRHNSRLLHAREPFQTDVLTRIYRTLAADGPLDPRLNIRNNTRLTRMLDWDTTGDAARKVFLLGIWDPVLEHLEHNFSTHASAAAGNSRPRREIADCFIAEFDKTAVSAAGGTMPFNLQYLSLLKCNFLLTKMKMTTAEVQAEPELSHWPTFIKSLEYELLEACLALQQTGITPEYFAISRDDDLLAIWPKQNTIESRIETAVLPPRAVMMEELLEVPLVTDSESEHKTLRLLRHLGSANQRFRILVTVHTNKPFPEIRETDVDISTTVLIACYNPSSKSKPTDFALIVKDKNQEQRFIFDSPHDMFKFQQGLTGFEVAGNRMDYCANVILDCAKDPSTPMLTYGAAFVQLWIPCRLHGQIIDVDTYYHPKSHTKAPVQPGPQISPGIVNPRWMTKEELIDTMFPARGDTTHASTSYSSVPATQTQQRQTTRPKATTPSSRLRNWVNKYGAIVSGAVGLGTNARQEIGMDPKPQVQTTRKPMLVLFTTKSPSFLTIEIEKSTKPNPNLCSCRESSDICQILVLEQQTGNMKQPLGAREILKIDHHPNLLEILEPRQTEVTTGDVRSVGKGRVVPGFTHAKLFFTSVDERRDFGGRLCDCDTSTEALEMECAAKGHLGLLGQARMWHKHQSMAGGEGGSYLR